MRRGVGVAAGLLSVVLAASACHGPPSPAPSPSLSLSPSLSPAVRTADPDTFITAYTWYDNTPPGSPDISHPVLHKKAGGTGTYTDPVTVAVGHSMETGKDVLDFPPGTRIYLPDVRRYFIVEDTCGDGPAPEEGPCHAGAREHGDASTWLDIWIGGDGESESFAKGCTERVTGVHAAVFDPAGNYVVASGAGVIHDGMCDSGYGNQLITTTPAR